MRRWLIAVLVTACGLVAAGVLGTAGAQETATTPTDTTATAPPAPPPPARSITVIGAGSQPGKPGASAGDAKALYRDALGAAFDDAKAKAQFLADRAGVKLGDVLRIEEQDGGPVACPMVGVAQGKPVPATAAPKKAKKKRKKRKGTLAPARPSQVATTPAPEPGPMPVPPPGCDVSARVSVTYAIG